MAKKVVETPLMKQYKEMKAKHPDAILLFRVGDFYETFEQDAEDCSEILGITLTSRANGANGRVRLAGFPHHSLDTYFPKLVRAGKRVAICEQLEDKPKVVEDVEAEEVKPTPESPQPPSQPELVSDEEFAALKALVDELLPDDGGAIGWEPFDGDIAIFHLDDQIMKGKCSCLTKSVHTDENSPWRHDVGDIVYMLEFEDADGYPFHEEASQLTKETYNKVMEKLKEEMKAQQEQPQAAAMTPMQQELLDCALTQLPQDATIIAAQYVPIGDDNGKWKIILKMGDAYRYADIVVVAQHLYICDRVFATADEVATLMGIPLESPTPESPTPEPEPEPEPEPDEIPFTPELKAPTDAVLEMKKMFMDEYGMDNDAALMLADKNIHLYELLTKETSVEFTFRKKDGSERKAHGTLHPDVVPEVKVDPNKPKREPNPKMQTYFDLDKQQWRCFEKVNLIDVTLPF